MQKPTLVVGQGKNSSSTPARRDIIRPVICLLLIALAGISLPAAVQEVPSRRGVLEPEDANEARLNQLQPPAHVMDVIGIVPGFVVAIIGAWRGRYAVQLAVRVGEQGRVYAEDIDGAVLQYLHPRCEPPGPPKCRDRSRGRQRSQASPASLDLVFIVSSYHHFEDPVTLLRKAGPALKPNGKLAIVEWAPRPGADYATPERMAAQMKEAGYKMDRIDRSLEANRLFIYIFSPADHP